MTSATLVVLAITLPTLASLAAFLLPLRAARIVVLLVAPATLAIACWIGADLLAVDEAILVPLGGWAPPLGIALKADGLSAAMLIVTAAIIAPILLFALLGQSVAEARSAERSAYGFWVLAPGVWAALNTVYLANDLFTLYVGLELLTFSAVPLVVLDGRAATLAAGLRYLLISLVGGSLYLLGTGFLYGAHGTLDAGLLTGRLTGTPVEAAAIGLITVGLLAKIALVPFHLWLPPAHAGAAPAASALLSALVVKGSYFVLLRVWLDIGRGLASEGPCILLAGLGAIAILLGSELALRQSRLKLLVAYSTVAQIGYLFLVFPIVAHAAASGDSELGAAAVTGGMLQAISHAFAKAGMFLAVGVLAVAMGHDRIDGLAGIGRRVPLATAAILVAGLSLMGLPPSGGFWAKWLLLTGSVESGQWWWALVILVGGLLAGAYTYRVIGPAFGLASGGVAEDRPLRPVTWGVQVIPLGLALASLLLGLMAIAPPRLLLIGRLPPGAAAGLIP